MTPLRSRLLACLSVLGLTYFGPRASPAQVRTLFNSEQVPRDLVIALLSYDAGLSDVPELLIGEIPPILARRIPLPAGARVLGTLLSPEAVVVVETPLPPDSLREFLRRQLPQRGWMAPLDPRYYGYRGFVPSIPRSLALLYCAQGQGLTFQVIPRGKGASLAKIRIFDDEREPRCNPKADEMSPRTTLPSLVLPSGTEMNPTKCVGLTIPRSSSADGAIVRSSLSPEQLMAHFGKQMADSGWTPEPPPVGERVVSQTWRRPRPSFDGRRVTVSVIVPRDSLTGCRTLTIGFLFGDVR